MIRSYRAVAALAFRHRLRSIPEVWSRVALYFIILGIWWRVWNATGFGGFAGFSPTQALWYLMGTEWIVLSIPYVYLDIEADMRSGDFAYALLRPVGYSWYHYAQGVGIATANWLVFGVSGFLMTWGLTGALPQVGTAELIGIIALVWLSLVATCHIMVALGLLSAWTQDAGPCAWVWQKLQFVVGGLMLPLTIYPEWFHRWSHFTPFPALLGDIMVPFVAPGGVGRLLLTFAQLVVWTAAFVWVVQRLEQRTIRKTLEE